MQYTLPFSNEEIHAWTREIPTPFYVYDQKWMLENLKAFQKAFAWNSGFQEYYAVKACPNPSLLKLLASEGCGADCSSLGELLLAQRVGLSWESIMFTSNDTPREDFELALDLDAILNFDDLSHIPYVCEEIGRAPSVACCRYNPWPLKAGNAIIGKPEEAKYGMMRTQLTQAYTKLKWYGVKKFGLHTMVASNELSPDYFVETAKLLFEVTTEIENEVWIAFSFINIGWGIWIPYRPWQEKVDFQIISDGIYSLQKEYFGSRPIKLACEMGRMITGPYGYLVTKIIHTKSIYKDYLGTDASMADLMRPWMYGAYHHISVIGKENEKEKHVFDITGSLCENNDKFAVDRELPASTTVGDVLVIHDAGAHGHAMWFNYNAKLRHAEYLLTPERNLHMIRRPQTLWDYFATLDFPNAPFWDLALK